MAGIDEPSARSALAAMQDRLARDPTSALGLAANPSPDDVRAAFLELTKLFHPVRFGRMAPDIQKLSNEVFLALRAAHDSVAKSAGRRSSAQPIAPGPVGGGASRAATPLAPGSVGGAASRPATPSAASPARPAPIAGAPIARPGGSIAGPPITRSAVAPGPAVPRTITPTATSKPPTTVRTLAHPPPAAPAARPPVAGNPVRQSGGHPVVPAAPAPSEASVLDLLQRQQWDQARSALHQMLARDPNAKRVRALMAYARGREAQLDRRLDDARVELHDALDLDPSLELAKTALTELFTRRR